MNPGSALQEPRSEVTLPASKFSHPAKLVSQKTLLGLWVLAGTLALLLVPVWAVHLPPLVDYPDHLARGYLLFHLNDEGFSNFYRADWTPSPNLAIDILLLVLQNFMPALVAGRVLLSLAVISVPLASWFFLRRVSPGQEWLSLLTALIAYNRFLIGGFMSFQLSLALVLVALPLWMEWRERWTLQRWAMLCALASMIYLCHLVGFGVFAFLVGVMALVWRRDLRETFTSWALLVPSLVAYGIWKDETAPGWPMGWYHSALRLRSLGAPFRTYSRDIDAVFMLAAIATLLALRWKNPQFRWNRRMLALTFALAALYAAIPVIDGQWIHGRLSLFLFCLVLATFSTGERARKLAPLLLLLVALRTGYVTWKFWQEQPKLQTLQRGLDQVPKHARVVCVVGYGGRLDLTSQDYAHFCGYGVIQRQWLTPSLLLDAGRMQPHPVKLRESLYSPPMVPDSRNPWDSQKVQAGYEYLWTYQAEPAVLAQIQEIAKLTYEEGALKIFKIKKSDAAPEGAAPPVTTKTATPRSASPALSEYWPGASASPVPSSPSARRSG